MAQAKPKKIFIVDDDEMLTMALSDYLAREVKHDIHIFHKGEDCIKHLEEKPEVIILDFHLNTVDRDAQNGLEILTQIRKIIPNQRFIMLSSQESYATAARTIAKGAEQYVIKDDTAFEKISKMLN